MSNQSNDPNILGIEGQSYPEAKREESWSRDAEEAYKRGAFDDEVCEIIRITKKKFDEIYNSDANFRQFIDYGRTCCKAYWYRLSREYAIEMPGKPKLNAAIWQTVMKNMFGWGDNKPLDTTLDTSSMSKDEMKSQIKRALKGVKFKDLEEYKFDDTSIN